MGECTHDCSSCGENCSSRQEIQKDQLNQYSSIKKVIGVVSGKGGVGKSLVTSLAASELARRGYRVGVMDADITGPSIPKMFGIHDKIVGSECGMVPQNSMLGIGVVSINLLLPNETDPVIWRGPVIAGVVKQFWSEVFWADLDYLLIDMPPGTGDVPLTVFQSIPVDGILIVSSPQQLVEMIVGKAVEMAKMMKIPVLGLVENMSYVACPDCGKTIELFGSSKAEEVAGKYGIDTWTRMPLRAEVAKKCDMGRVEEVIMEEISPVVDKLENL